MFIIALCLSLFFTTGKVLAEADALPSWRDGAAKNAILQFVKQTTDADSADFIPMDERIATFDQDGTLWVEQPLYTQFVFAFDRMKALAPQHPEWKEKEPYKSILEGHPEILAVLNVHDIERIVAETHAGMTIEAFFQIVKNWLETSLHPRFKKPYTDLIYQPMLEVIRLLNFHGYKTYIVSGGGQEFMRVYSEKIYGIPPEQVIGTAGKVKYSIQNGRPDLIKLPEVFFIDDKEGKPEGINLIIGRRPSAAFGNSDGDRQMLEWTQGGAGKSLKLLVHHDDPIREYAYGSDSKIGTFSSSLMEESKKSNWIVVSMKNDWKIIFPWEK